MKPTYKARAVDGLLEIEFLERHESIEMVIMLRDRMRRWSANEVMTLEECLRVNRASRIAYEVHSSMQMTYLDAADVEILYSLKEDRIPWLHEELNKYRGMLRVTDPSSVLLGHQMAMGVGEILDS